ncbi:MAG: rhomboid family intramembrane serine protease [Deltaproteobacteria bacterium]|nr:rhomboid family intramembrane serine protease [Deltaproteobacteria bacterium]
MFLIPIGNDCGPLRRVPVVTFGIIVLCSLVYLAHPAMTYEQEQQVGEYFSDTAKYYVANPDLTPAPELKQAIDRVLATLSATERRQAREELDEAEPDEASLAQRQKVLDNLTARWLAAEHDDAAYRWGLIPAQFSWLKLLTSMFIHGGLLHLLFNMLFLYLTGPSVEDVWGRPIFAVFYLAAGMAAGGLFALQDPTMSAPLVGASGAIAGVMGAFAVRWARARIKMMFLALIMIRVVRFEFSVPAWFLLPLWFLGELVSARGALTYQPLDATPMVAYWAHVWGFAFGAVFALGMKVFKVEERFITEAIAEREAEKQDPVTTQLTALLDAGRVADGCRLLAAELLRHPNDIDLGETFWHLARLDQMRDQQGACLRLIRTDLAERREALAIERWLELHAAVPEVAADGPLTIRLFDVLTRTGKDDAAAAALSSIMRRLAPTDPAELWAQVADRALDAKLPDAVDFAHRALANPRLRADSRRTVEQKLLFHTTAPSATLALAR